MLARRAASMARAAAQLVCYRQDALRLLLLRPAFATMIAYIPLHRARLAACHFAYRCCVEGEQSEAVLRVRVKRLAQP